MINYSVLMSVYAREKPLNLAYSIDSMLRQTKPTDNFVLVCDGPLTRQMDLLIADYVRQRSDLFNIIRLEKNLGLGKALNKGLAYCKNDLIARMDSDDVAASNRCEKQLKIFCERNIDIVGGSVEEFSSDISQISGRRVTPQTHDEILKFARRRCPFNHPCVMFKKQAVEKAGGYQDFFLFEDYYLWIRMLQTGARGYNLPDTLVYMRTDDDMYRRRGGIRYMVSMLKFRNHMKETGFISFSDYLIGSIGQALVCLLPNSVRKLIYKNLIRK